MGERDRAHPADGERWIDVLGVTVRLNNPLLRSKSWQVRIAGYGGTQLETSKWCIGREHGGPDGRHGHPAAQGLAAGTQPHAETSPGPTGTAGGNGACMEVELGLAQSKTQEICHQLSALWSSFQGWEELCGKLVVTELTPGNSVGRSESTNLTK
ncbi:hypothetical protein Y1Q_0003685 [Alligator mississippiensis]|uniref:Uncharacterized protein n=1 Tax=Alligator mississippiensis TaxID=8496 RepID=A0A151MSQ1_ALLMI|nr:hypothetical protein Y1Q_0003685 [Alligator mississippiensis]